MSESRTILDRSRRHQAPASGLTLLELIAVLTVLGTFAAVAMSRWSPSTLSSFQSRADARGLALDLLQAQRRTVATGDHHYVLLIGGGTITSYEMYRKTGGGDLLVEPAKSFPSGVTVTSSHTQLEFDFEGAALAAYQVTLTAEHYTWRVSVIPSTGAVKVEDVTP
ncbi:MAG: type II secretion system protein [Planctomycetes bacterium]|nr:type II secretion system protein [Planctomycetota bacterium]